VPRRSATLSPVVADPSGQGANRADYAIRGFEQPASTATIPSRSNEEEDVNELSGKMHKKRAGRQPCSSSWTPLTGSSSSRVEETSTEAVTEPAAEADDGRRWLALAVIVTAQFMVVLDISIVNVALPSIKTDLHFSQEGLQWVITAYAIFFGGFLLLGGRLADLLGRRRLFMAGVSLFTVSSLLNGLACRVSVQR
jgi:MFS transporter